LRKGGILFEGEGGVLGEKSYTFFDKGKAESLALLGSSLTGGGKGKRGEKSK